MAVSAGGRALNTPRGRYLHAYNARGRVPLYGGCEEMGYFTIACNYSDGGYEIGRTSIGNTYMQIVHFGPEGVEAYTMLAHGMSESALGQGPGGQENTGLYRYARKDWLRMPFREEDIMRDRELKQSVLYP
jgi:acyl-homoserine-lactone acylase